LRFKGDPAAPVNRGLNCIKGYFNAKIMYGADRLKTPLLRVNDKGEFDKHGKFKPVSWKRAFDEMEKAIKRAQRERSGRCRGLRIRSVHRHGRIRSPEDDESGLPLQRHRPQRTSLYGIGRCRFLSNVRY